MDRLTEVEKLFYQDVREKKRIGNNIYKRKSTRRGGSNMSTMRVPTKKQQKEWSGEVMTFNLNKIIPIEEFEVKSLADQKLLMEHWRTQYKAKDIIDAMNINRNAYYNLVDSLGIPKAERRPKGKRDKPLYSSDNIVTDKELKKERELDVVIAGEIKTPEPELDNVSHETDIKMSHNGFNFNLKGSYDSETIVRRLMLIINEIELSEDNLNIDIQVSSN